MTLSEHLRQYRDEKGLSQRQFAIQCGLSNGYISMLEKGENPKTGRPLEPTLQALRKLANGMGTNLGDLLLAVDDIPISLLSEAANSAEKELSALIAEGGFAEKIDMELTALMLQLTHDQKLLLLAQLKSLIEPKQ